MAISELDSTWKAAFVDKRRPQLYTSAELNEDGFRPLADPLDFIADMSKLTTAQLYAQATNNQTALRQAQDEYLELEKIVHQLKSRDPTALPPNKHAQLLPPDSEFEERKESILYGYKYDANRPLASYGRWQDVTDQERRDLRSYQDPFSQGGFVPNDRQFKGLLNRAKDRRNPDDWLPIERNGKRLIPKMAPRINEKEEYWQLSGLLSLSKGSVSKPVTRSGTPDVETTGISGRDTPINKRLRNTRFNGAKVPLTRDVSEAPSLPVSRASTPKRKRGDTPMAGVERNGSPVKKPRLMNVERALEALPRRRQQSLYAKSRDKAVHEATAARKMALGADSKMANSPVIGYGENSSASDLDKYPWSNLTDQEKRDYHWNNETLLLAVREDPTWLNEDSKTRQKWMKKILDSKYPVRTYSMYKKWDYWRLIGEDKRPRNKKKRADSEEADMDAELETANSTPSPPPQLFLIRDRYHKGATHNHAATTTAVSSGTKKSARGEAAMHYRDMEEFTTHETTDSEAGESRRTWESDSASQTISVNQEDAPVYTGRSRRVTRASRKAI